MRRFAWTSASQRHDDFFLPSDPACLQGGHETRVFPTQADYSAALYDAHLTVRIVGSDERA